MFTVYTYLVGEHDLRLVGLAGIICAIASFTAFNILHHIVNSRGAVHWIWLCIAATASGFGVWATHFIALLAYSPGVQSGYNLVPTVASLISAVILTGMGLAVAVAPDFYGRRLLGGAIVGGGIAVTHYTGMAAFEVAGRIEWNPTLVAASVALAVALGAIAMSVGLRNRSFKSMMLGSLILTLAICSHHFTAMAAAALVPDPTIVVPPTAAPISWLVTLVAGAAFTILLLTIAGLALDIRDRRQAERESLRMRNLADAAFEGLLVCEGNTIATANATLSEIVQSSAEWLAGRDLATILPEEAARRHLEEKPNVAIETTLHPSAGKPIPVEAISRPIAFADKPHRAIAVRDLRDRKKAESDIYYLAHHDALTGLVNRNKFNTELDQLIQAHRPKGSHGGAYLAVLCLDLDRFKEVNDLFGHAAGDMLLQKTAQRTQKALRKGQTMGRLGGDEFAIIAPGLSDPVHASRIAESVIEALRAESENASTADGLISASIGIAIFPADADDRMSLLSHADTALYRAKAEGRGTYRFYESSMGEQIRSRRLIEHDLRFAIARRELSLVYQPQARTHDRQIIGFEALLRWHNPVRGEIPPSVFVPIAEESGAIIPIGEWVLREACREAAKWKRSLTIAVNVSATQLHSSYFSQVVHEVLLETGLEPSRLELEITETALIRDLNRGLATLDQLKALGVRIVMDDFGAGYSSLSNLRAFAFDKIKIDRSFIKLVNTNEQAATIVRAVLGLGRGLKLPVIAEGVETEAELAFLDSEACLEVQGFLLGRPQSIKAFQQVTGSGIAKTSPAEPSSDAARQKRTASLPSAAR
ncbi:bifunctional diguanylate cyclase/phosphodiesterase [Methylovirgula sp. 4M-Z18]|uniref:bifunctional diguanylate cyclase/phosphodiesterase n=1 Tax=Methylovirgula sp. 4M-Z18 TaxID=2293567 RepID=UPI000E2E7C3B|nr:EAL domain-containing protein [Methylovirgula sp. 4M-Z18]RFB78178.1 EAL domain-containing protein [Methylovirgula sp. 4M-Z18]